MGHPEIEILSIEATFTELLTLFAAVVAVAAVMAQFNTLMPWFQNNTKSIKEMFLVLVSVNN